MKKDNKKALYESIMTAVAKEVKKALNERYRDYNATSYSRVGYLIDRELTDDVKSEFLTFRFFVIIDLETSLEECINFLNNDIDIWVSRLVDINISGGRVTAQKMRNLEKGESIVVDNKVIVCI